MDHPTRNIGRHAFAQRVENRGEDCVRVSHCELARMVAEESEKQTQLFMGFLPAEISTSVKDSGNFDTRCRRPKKDHVEPD